MTGKRRVLDGEVYIWTRRGWRLVRDGMIRTRRGWRKMRQQPRGPGPTPKPSPPQATAPITDPIPPTEAAPSRSQWHGKYAVLRTSDEGSRVCPGSPASSPFLLDSLTRPRFCGSTTDPVAQASTQFVKNDRESFPRGRINFLAFPHSNCVDARRARLWPNRIEAPLWGQSRQRYVTRHSPSLALFPPYTVTTTENP